MTIIDLSKNENPLGPPPGMFAVLRKKARLVTVYPLEYIDDKLLKLLSSFFRVGKGNISLGIGSTQLFFDIPRMLSYKRALIVSPTFWEYSELNLKGGRKIKKIYLNARNGFKPDYPKIGKNISRGDAVFICNVNNPTSVLYQRDELIKLIDKSPDTEFIVDETYLILRNSYSKESLVWEAVRRKNLHIIISLSKIFSISGARIGVIISNKSSIRRYNDLFFIPYSLNTLARLTLEYVLPKKAFVQKTRRLLAEERRWIKSKLSQEFDRELHCIDPDGNFVFCRILTGKKSRQVSEGLRSRGIIIRGGHELPDIGDDWIRFTIRTRRENRILLKNLKKIL